jgi:colanic acid/amylovoran biosynthesis glycosyltransferase
VGRLDKVKGHSYCVEVTKLLVDTGYDVTLTIVGDGVERNNLEELIERYQLENRVILKGEKSQLEIRQLFWEHDLYLLTAVALPDGRRETQGLATLEAQACGLPVVVFDSGGVRYTVKDGYSGFVCEEYNVQQFVTEIKKFKKDPSLLIKMSEQAINFVDKNFSHKVIDEKWESIYSNLSNEK